MFFGVCVCGGGVLDCCSCSVLHPKNSTVLPLFCKKRDSPEEINLTGEAKKNIFQKLLSLLQMNYLFYQNYTIIILTAQTGHLQ